ncbi:hypothetical protein N7457_006519 [Penicillium paradoxum]|uniref:uncharacterized protein n=1 Tax=Penicillium paradoxum TaxID=176176 RepID=UPI0025474069|nr:uncharacterized protein N7457_006519 [Penicillium paradoxum]KAJ5781359.1 hypothetical protein N7457_006519 [Penicillium paradoxum]
MQRLQTPILRQLPRALLYNGPRRNLTATASRFNGALEQDSYNKPELVTAQAGIPLSVPQQFSNSDGNLQHSTSGVPQSIIEKVGKPGSFWVGKEELYLHMDDQKTIRLPYTYLRDLCQCGSCKDQHSKQRSFRTSDIPKDIAPSRVNWNGKQLSITWANDISEPNTAHESTWDCEFLKRPVFNTHQQHQSADCKRFFWGRDEMIKMQHWVSYEDYTTDESKFATAMRALQRQGLIFVKDIPKSRSMVEKVATRMGPLRNTFYGSTFDVRTVPEAINVAYTNQFLGFHMDLMYMNEPPGYQLLHCLENSCSGGESMFGDTFYAAEVMKLQYPEEYKLLCEQRLGYEYRHENHIYYNERPVFEHDPQTKELRHVNYAPPFQSPLPTPDGKDHDASLVNKLRDSLAKFTSIIDKEDHIFELKLSPGECVIFDNRRTLHARRQFNSSEGSRWLAGAYVDTDALLSRFAVCQHQQPSAWRHNSLESPVYQQEKRDTQ